MLRYLRASEADLHTLEKPGVIDDYWRAVRSFSSGALQGYVAEQVELATSKDEPLDISPWHMTILLGAQDMLHDAATSARYWAKRLPGAKIQCLEDAGRLLSFSHADLVIHSISEIQEIAAADRKTRHG